MWKFSRGGNFRVFRTLVFFAKIYPHAKIKPICLYEGNRSSIVKITPMENVLPMFSRNFPPAKITMFTELMFNQNIRTRTRQIILYRATATLLRPQIKEYKALKLGERVTKPTGTSYNFDNLWKYEAVHPMAVSENNSSSGMLII